MTKYVYTLLKSNLLIISIFICAFGLVACNPSNAGGNDIQSGNVTYTGEADIGGPFSLINHENQPVTEADFIGQPQLIYFGFSFCPDICPTELQRISALMERVDPKGEKIQPLFISVDPERDTPDALALYVTADSFPDNLVGLTGSVAQVEATNCLLYTSPSPRDQRGSRMPSSA